MFLHFSLCVVVIFYHLVNFHIASCNVFYIVTTQDGPCPGEFDGVPCLTLQQYTLNPSRSQDMTLLLEPGAYYALSTALTVSNCYNFTMSSDNVTMACTSLTARLFLDTVDYIHIIGVTLQV